MEKFFAREEKKFGRIDSGSSPITTPKAGVSNSE